MANQLPDSMSKKMGIYRHGVFVTHHILVNDHLHMSPERFKMVNDYKVFIESKPYHVNVMGKRDPITNSSNQYEYRVPRWITIEQARANTPDKWDSMRPANWTSYSESV